MNQPTHFQDSLQRAVELHRAGRLAEAEPAYRELLAAEPGHPGLNHLLGVLLHQTGQPERAVPLLERAAAAAPAEPRVHASLGRAHHALGHHGAAVAPLRRAAELTPHEAQPWSDLGAVLQEDGQDAEAEAAYRRALTLDPQLLGNRYNLATLLKKQGRLGDAVAMLEQLTAEAPGYPRASTLLAGYLLECGRVDEAMDACGRALRTNARDLLAMTFLSVALLRAGDHDGARRLCGLEHLVHARAIDPPPGHADLAAFNAALERHVMDHPTLEYERPQNATRNGRHTDNLLRERERGPMADLEQVFDAAVRAYLEALPADPSHPYLAHRPTAWRLQAWAVVMHHQGHQRPHVHADGWVSGVYYPRVPQAVGEDDPQQRGWLEFGRPLPELLGDATPPTRRLRPFPGLLVLFPSYLYHETVPFHGDDHRISIAFDACPRAFA